MSQLSNITASPMIRTFVQGSAQTAVRPIGQILSPTVPVPTLIGRYKEFTAKHRFKVPDTRRSINGKAVRIGFNADDKTYDCNPHAIDFPIDNLEKIEDAQLELIVKEAATLIADVATLDHELLVVNTAIAALTATAQSYDFSSAAVDPVKVLDGYIRQVILAAKNGAPVKLVVGAGAWLGIKNNPNFLKRFIVAAGRSSSGGSVGLQSPQLEDLSALLFTNPQCELSMLVQDTAAEGVAESVSFILDKKIILFASRDNPTRLDPSFMKTFRLDGQWMVPGSYVPEDQRGEVLKMDWSEDVRITNAPAAQLIIDTEV